MANYLEIKNADKGYLLTFDFRKEVSNERKEEWIKIGEKDVFSVMVQDYQKQEGRNILSSLYGGSIKNFMVALAEEMMV